MGRAIFRAHACLACSMEWASQETIVPDSIAPLSATRRNRLLPIATGSDGGKSEQKSDLTLISDPDPSGLSKPNQRETERDEPPAILIFPTHGKAKTWAFTEEHKAPLELAFPHMDVIAVTKKALAWCHANPRKQKTPDGMARFLFNWLTKTQNDGGGPQLPLAKPKPPPGLCVFHATTATANKPSRFPEATCAECRHVASLRNPRPSDTPTAFGGG